MINEKINKEMLCGRGLIPTELAESKINESQRQKCNLLRVLKFILILAVSIVVVYFVCAFTKSTNTFIEIENFHSESLSPFQKPIEKDVVVQQVFKNRNKRHVNSNIANEQQNRDDTFNIKNMQKSREIVMNDETLCNEDNPEATCKDLVLKIKTASQIDASNEKDTNNIINQAQRNNKHNAVLDQNVQKPEVQPDSVPFRSIGDEVVFRPQAPSQIADNCLLARLLKNNYAYVQEVLNIPINEYKNHHHQHGNEHNHQQFSHHSQPHNHHSSADISSSLHHQDIDIRFQKFFTPKPTILLKSNQSHVQSRMVECPTDSISCDNEETCIPESHWCNGKVDCSDVSDEARCSCKSRVDRSRICDGYFDCPFGEDEMGCNGCTENTFSCDNDDQELMPSQAICFTKEQRCNNIIDCPNQTDELDCNMLAPSLSEKPLFAVSNTEGFLHRNFKGDWYAVCKNPYMWAHDVCRRETGLIIRPPFIQMVQIDPLLKVHYLNTGPEGMLQTSNSCFNSSAVYVTCPDLLCGMRVLSSQQQLKENIEIENQLFGRNKRFLVNRFPFPFYNHNRRFVNNGSNFDNRGSFDVYSNTKFIPRYDGRNKRAQSRVVGGKASQPASWPWMVALYRNGKFHCGGNILTQRWVISAAHCVSEYWQHYFEIQVGMLRRFSFSPQEHNIRVTHIIANQRYSKADMKNDLSLLRTAKAIHFSRWVRPICLPGPETAGSDWLWGPSPGTMCTAVGWGATEEHGPDPDHLREVDVPVWAHCKHHEDIAGNEICAGIREGGKDACQGDSGGPLLCRNPLNSQQWYIAGIVSHGDGCGRKGEPGVYTRVSLFVKWIRYHIFSRTLPSTQPKQECPGFKCVSGIPKCLPNSRQCDKIVDCLNGEDEINCNLMRSTDTGHNEQQLDRFPNTTNLSLTKEAVNFDTLTDATSTELSTVSDSIKEITKALQTHDSTTMKSETDISGSEDIESDEDTTLAKSISRGDMQTSESKALETTSINFTIEKDVKPISENMREVDIEGDFTDLESITATSTTLSISETSTVVITSDEIITPTSKPEQIINSTHTDLNITNKDIDLVDQSSNADTDSLIIELLPSSMKIQNQTEAPFINAVKNTSSTLIFSTTTMAPINTTRPEKILNFDDKREIINEIEDIVLSELQPAKIRKKHRIPREFECRQILQNVSYNFRCDRKPDCEDGTDELDCSCVDYLASFDSKLLCDGEFDCADGQDEMECFECSEEKFLCPRSKVCIPTKYVCDGKAQCPQGEDELDCFTLSNGKEIFFEFDGRPRINLEGYVTKKIKNNWHIVCEEKLSLQQQEQVAGNICRYLGFSSANHYLVKHINIREEDFKSSSRNRRSKVESEPISFSYRRVNQENETDTHITIKKPQVLREECVPNITKTCMSLYVFCDQLLFTDFDVQQELLFNREAETVTTKISQTSITWPWIAKVFVEGEYKCSGILVDKSWVLVSHSCLWDVLLHHSYVSVVLGSYKLHSIISAYEQIYQVDAKKDLLRSKTTLLRLMGPVTYSPMVKPMIVFSTNQEDKPKICLANGQDKNNMTINMFLNETYDKCDSHSRCFKRVSKESICDPGTVMHRQWAGIISCHSEVGWYPAASFVEKKGECGAGEMIVASDIINLKNEIKRADESLPSSAESGIGEECGGVRCGRGRCMGLRQVCDGIKDCEDGNDESTDACLKKQGFCKNDPYLKGCDCASNELKCRNGKCVSKKLFRDGNDDCGDRSDEPEQTTCAHYLAKVKPSRLCDGVLHCHDRSDEDPMFCKCFAKRTYKCGKGTIDDVDQCVAPDVVCDGVRDCPNGEDETFCLALHAPDNKQLGTGEVIVRSHGIWHTKCYSTPNHTRSELESICRELGFLSGHAKLLEPSSSKLIFHPHNNVVLDQFSEIFLNNKTSIKLRNTADPMATAVFDPDLNNCHPVFIECV